MSATVIDALLVTLGLKVDEFDAGKAKVDKGLKETGRHGEETGKKLNKAGKDGAEGFENVAKSAAKFLALIGGTVAIKRFIEQQVEASAALDRFSRNLKENVATVSAWSNAAEIAGGSAGELQGTLDMLSQAQTELQLTGQSSLIPFFSALGVSMADARGKAKPVTDILLDLSDRFSRMDRTQANNMGRMMGLDQGTMNLLLRGRSEVELMIKRQKEYGAVTKQQAEESSRLREAMVQGRQSFEAFGRELLSAAMPALEKVFSLFADFGAWVRENKEFVTTFLSIMAAGLAAVGLAAMPINITVAAVTSLAGAIALLWQDYQTWKRGGDSLIDWSKWEPGIKAAGEGLRWLKKVAEDAFYRMAAGFDLVKSVLAGDWEKAKFAANELVNGNTAQEPSASGPPPATAGQLPRAIRNNNPGNLNYAGQAGATKEGGANGRFAVFGSMREGVAALVRQIGLYVQKGRNTIRKILEVYAPSSENDTASYIGAVSKALGIGPDDPLDPANARQVMALVKAIARHESGGDYLSDAQIAEGFQLAGGIRGASMAAAGAGAGARVAAAGGGNTTSIQTTIGKVEVHTAATDANGIARDMGKSMDYLFSAQANYGLS